MTRPTTITEPADLLLLREDLTLDQIEARAGVLYAGTGLRHRALAHFLHFVDSRGLYQAGGRMGTDPIDRPPAKGSVPILPPAAGCPSCR